MNIGRHLSAGLHARRQGRGRKSAEHIHGGLTRLLQISLIRAFYVAFLCPTLRRSKFLRRSEFLDLDPVYKTLLPRMSVEQVIPARAEQGSVGTGPRPRNGLAWVCRIYQSCLFAVLILAGCTRSPAVPVEAARTTWAKRPSRARPAPRSFTGLATYYSNSLAGHHTANGERYDPRALTAAHRFLPFGTRVRVTRSDTQKTVMVRVNDRGPFGNARRIIDLSRAAAIELGMLRAGVVEVELEILGR